MSDEYIASIEHKLMIQLISAVKKTYNKDELNLLKCHINRDLVGNFNSANNEEQQLAKFSTKKKLLLDSLKRIRMDMITEDVRNGVSENKKSFLEEFEKNLLQLSPEQLKGQILSPLLLRTEDMLSKSKRVLEKKKKQKGDDAAAEIEIQKNIDILGLKVASIIIDLYKYTISISTDKNFQHHILEIEPRIKDVETTAKKIDDPKELEDSKHFIQKTFKAFFNTSIKSDKLDAAQHRMYSAYMKGFIDRISYW
jgi:hypothetical protein